MPRYKRTYDEADLELPSLEPEVPEEKQEMLSQLRNMWEFASLMQYIFMFGHVVKVDDDFDIEVSPPPRCRFRCGMCMQVDSMMGADGCVIVGPGTRVLEASAVREARQHRPQVPQIRLLPPRLDVCTLPGPFRDA